MVFKADLTEVLTRTVCIFLTYNSVVIPDYRAKRLEVEFLRCVDVLGELLLCAEELKYSLFEHEPRAIPGADSLSDAALS